MAQAPPNEFQTDRQKTVLVLFPKGAPTADSLQYSRLIGSYLKSRRWFISPDEIYHDYIYDDDDDDDDDDL
jgi:hypothetical protein